MNVDALKKQFANKGPSEDLTDDERAVMAGVCVWCDVCACARGRTRARSRTRLCVHVYVCLCMAICVRACFRVRVRLCVYVCGRLGHANLSLKP